MPKRQKRCIFCGKEGKLTNEHLWPDWLSNHFPRVMSRKGLKVQTVHTPWVDGKPDGPPQVRNGDPASQRLELVCGKCNNGWMSEMQSDAKPYLLPLLQGRWKSLSSDGTLAVANWITMNSMVREFQNENAIVTRAEERLKFMQEKRPGENWLVGLAPY
jgi:hypothetical protein